jgi:multiple sugar transport system substrate-binding protein
MEQAQRRRLTPAVVALVALLLASACTTAAPTAPPTQDGQGESPTGAPPPQGTEPGATDAQGGGPAATPTPLIITPEPVPTGEGGLTADGKVLIRWFVGLGSGTNPQQIEAQQTAVADFNAAQDARTDDGPKILLSLEIVQNSTASDILKTQIASGNAPDIVGPVGVRGRNGFNDIFLDLTDQIERTGYDLSGYDPSLVEFFQEGASGQVGIPYAVFPSFIFYNKGLFDEADLPYPPHAVGELYDGKPWTWETLTELSKLLTVDGNGNDATSPDFDPEDIVQFGFETQYSEPRRQASAWGAGSYVGEDGRTVQIPEAWRTAWKWYYDAMWTDHFIPTDDYRNSDTFAAGNPTASGRVAMAHMFMWYSCCIVPASGEPAIDSWDIAVMPSYNDTITAPINADTFTIVESTSHPDEAFEVLTYLLGVPELLVTYGGMPARISEQPAFFEALDASFAEAFPGNDVDWQVALDMQSYPDIPNHEDDVPNFLKVYALQADFWTKLNTTPGLDMDAEIDNYASEIQALVDQVQP